MPHTANSTSDFRLRGPARIASIAKAYASVVSGAGVESIAQDIIADTLHWCEAERGHSLYALRMAHVHFEEERRGAGAPALGRKHLNACVPEPILDFESEAGTRDKAVRDTLIALFNDLELDPV